MCPLLKKKTVKKTVWCLLLKNKIVQKCGPCPLLKKENNKNHFSCLLLLTATELYNLLKQNQWFFSKTEAITFAEGGYSVAVLFD
jgi:hypothetical protein